MTLYLVAIHHPDNYDPGVSEDAGMDPAIDALNDDMVAAGVRIFVGGLQPPGRAVSLTMGMDGEVKNDSRAPPEDRRTGRRVLGAGPAGPRHSPDLGSQGRSGLSSARRGSRVQLRLRFFGRAGRCQAGTSCRRV